MTSRVSEEPDRLVVPQHSAIVGLNEVSLVLCLVLVDSSRLCKLLLLAVCEHQLAAVLVFAVLQLKFVNNDLLSIVCGSDPLSVDVSVVAVTDDLTRRQTDLIRWQNLNLAVVKLLQSFKPSLTRAFTLYDGRQLGEASRA